MATFIPALKYTNGSIEVFTTKFGGLFFDDMTHASLYVSDNVNEFWHCLTKEVAKERARDKTLSCGADDMTKKTKAFFIEV